MIRLLDLTNGAEVRASRHCENKSGRGDRADGKTFASGGQDYAIRLWNIEGEPKPRELATLPDCVRCLCFSPDGKHLWAGGFDTKVHVIDVESGKTLATWVGHDDAVMALALSPDGRTLLSAGGYRDQSVCVRDSQTGEIRRRLVGHRHHVCAVVFVDNQHAVSAGYDNVVRLWDLEAGKVQREFSGHNNGVYGLAVSRDRNWVAMTS